MKAYCDNPPITELLKRKSIGLRARRIASALGLKGPLGLPDLIKLSKHRTFSEYEINLYDTSLFCKRVWRSEKRGPKKINILLHQQNSHYYGLKNPAAALNCKHYCYECDKAYNSQALHRCDMAFCTFCKKIECENIQKWVEHPVKTCDKCFSRFLTKKCYEAHLPTDCEKYVRCKKCKKRIFRKTMAKHKCGVRYCPVCQIEVTEPHNMHYMKGFQQKDETADAREMERPWFLYYDLECIMSSRYQQANLVVAVEEGKLDQPKSFWGASCVEDFLQYLFDEQCRRKTALKRKKPPKCIAIAHNASAFDAFFLFRAFLEQGIKVDSHQFLTTPNSLLKGYVLG